MTDVQSIVAGGTTDDQKKQGTHVQHLSRLSEQFDRLVASGAATPERYRELCSTLLRSFEGLRLEQEHQIADYQAKIAYCRATQQGCSMFSSLLIGILGRQVQEVTAAAGHAAPAVPGGNGQPITDTEMLRQICACGCVDGEDAAQCDCSCHEGVPCENPACVVCQAERVLETAGRRRAPGAKKKPSKKKRTARKKKPPAGDDA